MKKVFIFLLIIAVCAVGYYFGKDYLPFKFNKLESIGYSSESAKKIKELGLDAYLGGEYYEVIDKALKSDTYINDYLQDYMKIRYVDNDLFIDTVNDLLESGKSAEEINKIGSLMGSKYFKSEYANRYISYQEKNKDYTDEQVVIYVNIGLDNDFYTNIKEIENPNDLLVLVNKYNKLPDDYEPDDLVSFDDKYTISSYKKEMRRVAHDALIKLIDDIRDEGMNLWVNSTMRTASYQNGLFTNSVKKNGMEHALKYSAKSRHSEHETGLAVDMSSVKGMLDGFENYKEYDWLKENAHKYGFIERYPKGKEWITGYAYESWHYRYVGIEAATIIKNENITYEEYAVKYLGY